MAVPGFYRCGGLHARQQLVPPLDPWIVVQVFPVQPVHSAQAAPHVVASLHPEPLAERAWWHCSRLVARFCPDLFPSLGCHRFHSFLLGTATSTGDTSPDSPRGELQACLRYWSGNLDSGRSSEGNLLRFLKFQSLNVGTRRCSLRFQNEKRPTVHPRKALRLPESRRLAHVPERAMAKYSRSHHNPKLPCSHDFRSFQSCSGPGLIPAVDWCSLDLRAGDPGHCQCPRITIHVLGGSTFLPIVCRCT